MPRSTVSASAENRQLPLDSRPQAHAPSVLALGYGRSAGSAGWPILPGMRATVCGLPRAPLRVVRFLAAVRTADDQLMLGSKIVIDATQKNDAGSFSLPPSATTMRALER